MTKRDALISGLPGVQAEIHFGFFFGLDRMMNGSLKQKVGLHQIIGEHPGFVAQIEKLPVLASCDSTVLITGETGTGKELCARAIHYLSSRFSKPFIPVNCGAIPLELLENELFGHERGAYTSASISHSGVVQEAHEGTLLLDEVDCLPLHAQMKLLRFLEEKEYRALGSKHVRKVNVRVIASTNVDLAQAVQDRTFRSDFYYRLNVMNIALPPLRHRKEDIPLLAHHFLNRYGSQFSKSIRGFSGEAMQKLIAYDWPGNIRELAHGIERAVIFAIEPKIQSSDILIPVIEDSLPKETFQQAKARVVAEFERTYIRGLLAVYSGNITQAARAAQKDRRAFWQLIRKHQINAQDFKTFHS